MLSLPFWAALAMVFFGLKWLAEAWLSLPGLKRQAPVTPRPMAISHSNSSAVAVNLREAA